MTTDSTGHYELLNLPTGKYSVRASVAGFATSEKTGVDLTRDHSLPLTFVIPIGDIPLGEIHVRVQTSSGAAVAGTAINISAVRTGSSWQGKSDTNGEYQFPGMPCVDYDVRVSTLDGKHGTRRIHVNAGASLITRIVLQ